MKTLIYFGLIFYLPFVYSHDIKQIDITDRCFIERDTIELGSNSWAAILPKPLSLDDLGITDESLMLASQNAGAVERGSAIYAANCTGCHGANGEGLSGPNLTDGYWLHGANATAIYTTIHVGVGAKGMPAWGGALGAQVKDVVAYVLSIKDTNVAGKEAQGVDSEGNAP